MFEAPASLHDSSRVHILVVDDEAAIRRVMQRTLQQAGYAVSCADGVAAACAELASSSIDVVVTDLNMPGGSGLDVMQAAHERDAGLPVLILTGLTDLATAEQALQRGALRYLTKPAAPHHLLTAVEEACRRRA